MSGLEEEAVDWDDVGAPTGVDQTAAQGLAEVAAADTDDVISLGGAEELEEEIVVTAPVAEVKTSTSERAAAVKPVEVEPVVEKVAMTSATPVEESPLPPGWKVQEARSGGFYYFNTVTGKTTWDRPTHDTGTQENKAGSAKAGEKLGGIQIRGSARVHDVDTPQRKEEDRNQVKKRETDSRAEGERTVSESQKRRRSKSPERDVVAPSTDTTPAHAVRTTEKGSNGAKAEVAAPSTKKVDEAGPAKGWGRSPEIAREASLMNGSRADSFRRYNGEARDPRAMDSAPRSRDVPAAEYRRRPEERDVRDRNYSQRRNDAVPEDRRSRYTDRTTDERRPLPQDDRERRTERRDDPGRSSARDTPSRTERSNVTDRVPPSADNALGKEREGENRRTSRDRGMPGESYVDRRDTVRDRERERLRQDEVRDTSRGPIASSAVQPASNDRQASVRTGAEARPPSSYRNGDRSDSYRERDAYIRRSGQYSSSASPAPQPTSGPVFERSGYHPRRDRLDAAAEKSSGAAASTTPVERAYGPRSKMAPPPIDSHVASSRSYGVSEDKQKRWWNKNSGERQPASPDVKMETSKRGSPPGNAGAAAPSPALPDVRDRERELAEREAAIARRERELGLR